MNLAMMGLRGLLIEMMKEHQRHENNRSLKMILEDVQIPGTLPADGNIVEIANQVAYGAEVKGVEHDMKIAAMWALLEGEIDLDALICDFLEPRLPIHSMDEAG